MHIYLLRLATILVHEERNKERNKLRQKLAH